MDFVLDILFGSLLGIFKMIMPRHEFKKWQEVLLTVLSVILLVASLGCFIAGVYILSLSDASLKTAGIALTAVGASLLFVQSITFFVLAGRQLKATARNKSSDNSDGR